MSIQKVFLCAVGLYFLYTGLTSGSPGATVIGLGLAAIAFFVAFTGRVHRKFTRRQHASPFTDSTDPSRYRDPDDEQLLETFRSVRNRLQKKNPEESSSD